MSAFPDIDVASDLLARARSGDDAALEQIYLVFERPVRTLARRLLAHRAAAEDVAQDVFVDVITRLHQYPGRGSFAGWVRSIVVSWEKIIGSTYNLHHCGSAERLAYGDLAGFLAQTVNAVKSGAGRKLVYAYWPEFDALAHRHGVGSAQARAHFKEVDAAFAALMAQLAGTDTLVVGTPVEDSAATGINGNQADNSAVNSGAVYVYVAQ